MMSFQTKATSLQTYNMLVYRQALHPEFFQIVQRQRLAYGEYEFEAWITRGEHAVRFEHNGMCVCEIVTPTAVLPDRGLVTALPCAGEKDHEQDFSDRIGYMTSIQTEILTDHLYLGTYRELYEYGLETNGLMAVWEEDDSKNMSLLTVQRQATSVHLQSFHLRSDCGLVLRTQSLFQVKDAKATGRKAG